MEWADVGRNKCPISPRTEIKTGPRVVIWMGQSVMGEKNKKAGTSPINMGFCPNPKNYYSCPKL